MTAYDALRTQILAHLMLTGAPHATAAQIAAAVGKPHGVVYAELRRMRGDGLVNVVRSTEHREARWMLRE